MAPQTPELPTLRPPLGARLREAWESRHVFTATARSNVPTYRGSLLGPIWLFLIPVMHVVGFGVLLGGVFNAKAPNAVPYLLFLILSMQAFRMFQMTLMYATVSTKMVKTRTRALRFPLLLVPLAAVSRTLLVLGIYWTMAAIVLIYYLIARGTFYLQLNYHLLIGFVGLALMIVFALALGLTTSVIYPRARDIRYVVRYVVQFWMFFTPVLYSIEALPHTYQVIAQFNPLTPLVGLVQYGFLNAGGLSVYGLLWSIAAIVLAGVFGLWFFNRHANQWIGVHQVRDPEEDDEEEPL